MSVYLPDTNLFRYLDNKDMESYKKAAQAFFSQAQKEQAEGTSIILLSEEVKCELEVQMHTLKDREKRSIQGMLGQTVSANLSVQLEHDLRKFSNYIRSPRFEGVFKIPEYKIDYLRTSDARILVDAYVNDAVLVTANIKDFITYSLFCEPGEQKMYDFLNQQYVEVSREARTAIAADPFFLSIQNQLENL
ncbi:DUF4411 family protein [Paenibacillus tepidiphilus]|uniref:DUF4411 family protein n=1 Tax=Paenibacillus tepidiphilus TaxID=2608683 RepID=UPI001238BC8B|nr:DUF4411 family protein [Paenibacillus tepidiphilus]